jgi:hypothetical protein
VAGKPEVIQLDEQSPFHQRMSARVHSISVVSRQLGGATQLPLGVIRPKSVKDGRQGKIPSRDLATFLCTASFGL